MKWMLVVLVFGSTPMQTGLVYNSLHECLEAEDKMRAEWDRTEGDAEGIPSDAYLAELYCEAGHQRNLHPAR